ncbi:MAG: hypothetical protein Q9M34_08175 [Sulfurimonas sp.]|nr:hypothetical protein [Sulfurimonas sp.]
MGYKYEILIVDDVSENIQVAISILKRKEYSFFKEIVENEVCL